MRKIVWAVFIAVIVSVTGCTSNNMHSAAITATLDSSDYEIVGFVTTEGTVHNLLVLIEWGGPTYAALLEEARAMGADDVMNIYLDKQSAGVFPFYSQTKTTFNATAIKYVR